MHTKLFSIQKRVFMGLTIKRDFADILNYYDLDSNPKITFNCKIYIRDSTLNLFYVICFVVLSTK